MCVVCCVGVVDDLILHKEYRNSVLMLCVCVLCVLFCVVVRRVRALLLAPVSLQRLGTCMIISEALVQHFGIGFINWNPF